MAAKKPKFTVGDVVRMKPNGFRMVVDGVIDTEPEPGSLYRDERAPHRPKAVIEYRCRWTAGRKVETDLFREEILESVGADDDDDD